MYPSKFRSFFCVLLSISCLFFIACTQDPADSGQPDPEPPGVTPPETDAVAEHWEDGNVFFGENKWTECVAGSMPLIISVPHGGTLRPDGIPDRDCPNITTVRDMNTLELAKAIEKELVDNYQVRPYLVMSHIARVKVDLNRAVNEATCGNANMVGVWHDYHQFLDTAVSTAAARHGQAIFIDLHGHGHANQRLEIGYSLSASDLVKVHSGLELPAMSRKSSLNNLTTRDPQLAFQDLILGDEAFGTMMEDEGFRTVPSREDPYPKSGESFFNGGYNTRYYTSRDYPNVFGWQIEAHNRGVRDSEANREAFAKAFAKVIMNYLKQTTNYE